MQTLENMQRMQVPQGRFLIPLLLKVWLRSCRAGRRGVPDMVQKVGDDDRGKCDEDRGH